MPELCLGCALIALALTNALGAATGAPQDLNMLIDGLQRKYSRLQSLEADFVQVYYGVDGRTLRETGHLFLKRPGRARWEYTSPERKLFLSDGKTVFFYVYGDKTATRSSIKETSDPQIPFLFLLGRGDLRRDFSRIEVAGGDSAIAAGDQMLRLFPKRAPEDFKQLLVEVSPGTFEVRRMVIFERSGARMDFLLSNALENVVIPDNQFHFTPPPGVAIKQAQ
jgi:outer membrane lipoprotein carrier protein